MTIYIDSDFKCHTTPGEELTAVETDAFDGKCRQLIEGYRFVPAGQTWIREDGEVFTGEMIAPWRDYALLAELQALYEEERANQADMAAALDAIYMGVTELEKAIAQMEAWAADPAHGYDQARRWGPDYDCSSAVISAWELAGVPVKTNGATYTGNMRGVFLRCGFADVTSSVDLSTGAGLQRGDVLLNVQYHAAMYCGDGRTVEASINEMGGTTGGMTGDQTGREFLIRAYRNYPWDCVLRYVGENGGAVPDKPKPTYYYSVKLPLLKPGMEDAAVTTVQQLLAARGYEPGDADGMMGEATVSAVRAFQEAAGILADGEVGGETWRELLKG